MTKRIYLSGPMTGIPDHNFPAFHEWAARLRAQGHEVVSPAELSEGKTWVECLRVDIRELCGCDAIALMPGWEASKGANLELHVAHRLELEVIPLPADEAAGAARFWRLEADRLAEQVAALRDAQAGMSGPALDKIRARFEARYKGPR